MPIRTGLESSSSSCAAWWLLASLLASACGDSGASDAGRMADPVGIAGASSTGGADAAGTSGTAGASSTGQTSGTAGTGTSGTAGTGTSGTGTGATPDDVDAAGTGAGAGGVTAGAAAGAVAGGFGGSSGSAGRSLDDFGCPGGTIAEGMNTIAVGTRMRAFYAEFPASMAGPIGIVFSWHGYNDPASDGDAAGWRSADEVDANADPSQPVVVVTPFDIEFEPPVGLDWQLDQGTSADNVDLALFEAMIGCLNAQYDIDPGRIYSYGFSAGSVFSSLIHSAYPDIVSAIVCVSGMWFNDPAQVSMINLIPVSGSWPVLDPGHGGTVLLTHGGPNDVTVLNIANLEDMAQAAFPFLQAANRVVIDCAHNGGHTLHPDLTTAHVMKFLADHRGGPPSPYASGGLSGYPSSCALRLP